MSLSALSITLVAAGTLITLIAGALWVRAWRGKATGWASCCRRCGFQLQGLNPDSRACPECGLDLGAAATLRPVTRRNEPRRWGEAAVATFAGLTLMWIGQPTQLFRTGRSICAALPNGMLIGALETMPSVAAGVIDDRVQQGLFSQQEVGRLAQVAAAVAAANPDERPGPGARVLASLASHHRMDPPTLALALRTALAGVRPLAGSPRACKPDGAFIVTAVLPSAQGASWITRGELRLAIVAASVREADGTVRPLASLTADPRGASREFDGAAFRAPSTPGTHAGEIRVRMRQPDGAFETEATAPFELRVLDPSSVQVTFASDARTATLLREWISKATCALDADGTGLLVSLPPDFTALQARPMAVAGALRLVQGDLSLDAGRIWIDEALPTISIGAVPMPAELDRTRPALLRFTPDLAFAMGVASSSCTALGDTVEAPIVLPPPPPAAQPSSASPAP